VKAWCAPIIASPDKPVVERSEQFFYEKERKRPIQFNAYVKQENIFHAILLRIGFMILGILSLFEFTRNILLKVNSTLQSKNYSPLYIFEFRYISIPDFSQWDSFPLKARRERKPIFRSQLPLLVRDGKKS